MQRKLKTALLVEKKKSLVSETEVCTHINNVQQFSCAHVLLWLGPGKIKFGDLSLPFFMPQERFLRCCKGHGPASAHSSTDVLRIHVGKGTCSLKSQVFWDVKPC